MANKRQNAPRNKRGNTKSKRDQLSVGQFAPTRHVPVAEPPPAERTIKVMKRIQVLVPAAASTVQVTPSFLSAGVPGGLTFWTSMRVDKLDIWGSDTDRISVEVLPISGWSQPPFVVNDSGSPGNRRCAVGLRLGLLDRARFFNTSDTTSLATVVREEGEIIVQATIELISTV